MSEQKPEGASEGGIGQSASTGGLVATDVIYSYKHDAYYSATTGKWLEKQCGSPDCEFCKDRPATANVERNLDARHHRAAPVDVPVGSHLGEKRGTDN